MTDNRPPPAAQGSAPSSIRFELYVAGDTLYSRRAIANLENLLKGLEGDITFEVIDVLKDPQAAFRRGIFGTPSLVTQVGEHQSLILGDLSDPEPVLRRLGSGPAG
ncbi:circadian clock protein KaiB [Ancylobacter sp. 3268]|uniref:circadian clock KaiB family protein n=1 Tax=Ancylobacter sp. 3268 TaxID=2817752 RepID=UPI0028664FB8|nr:circadian clock KaiB family protein [Ancylobacter sp. 3268]MDR6951131.1 circadian clock protein KaiB [Ancylobacter sp. 3268]